MPTRTLLSLILSATLAAPAWPETVVRVRDARGQVVAVLAIPDGGSLEITPRPDGPPPGPGPGPTPPEPIHPPMPIPPQPPAVGAVKHAVIVRDDTPGAMSPGQQAALRDPALRAQIERAGLNWHVFEVHSPEVTKPRAQGGKGYLPLVEQAGGAPCLLSLDAAGKPARPPIKLPDSAAGILAALGLGGG